MYVLGYGRLIPGDLITQKTILGFGKLELDQLKMNRGCLMGYVEDLH